MILEGDALATLAALPAESVHCVVTSPPYFGLRDYGTASWEGGDAGCDHLQRAGQRQDTDRVQVDGFNGPVKAGLAELPYRDVCRKCGARRIDSQLGLEPTPEAYVARMVEVFREVKRVLRKDGTCWVNMGDGYTAGHSDWSRWKGGQTFAEERRKPPTTGLKPKDLIGMPWRLAFALQADGWFLRSDIIWAKPNPMPESVTDRPTKAHEYVFLLTRSARYFWDADAVREAAAESTVSRADAGYLAGGRKALEGLSHHKLHALPFSAAGRNLRTVWNIPTEPFSGWTPVVRRVPVALDAVDDDTKRTASPDCPLHGDRSAPAPSDGRDGRGADSSSHIGRTDGRLDPEPPDDSAPIAPSPALETAVGSSDSPPLVDSPTATGRSTGTRRTAVQSVEGDRPDGGTPDHTGYTSPSGAAPGLGDSESPASSGTLARTSHTSACRCSFYREVTEQTSHFATFPKALVEPCIKAGTSERGCCPECGAPWERVVETGESTYARLKGDRSWRDIQAAQAHRGADQGGRTGKHALTENGTLPHFDTAPRTDTGWRPTCAHDSDPVPCTVLDPFAGSGTTGVVAAHLGRDFIGIELSPEYAAMARRRIENWRREYATKPAPKLTTGQLGLFGGEVPAPEKRDLKQDAGQQIKGDRMTGFNARWKATHGKLDSTASAVQDGA